MTLKEGYKLVTKNVSYSTREKILSSGDSSILTDNEGNYIETDMFTYQIEKGLFSSVGKIKIIDIKKSQKQVYSPVLPSTSFSFSGSRLPTFLIAGFVLGFITFAIIGSSSSSDPYGCTQCDVFAPGYDGPPPIEMDLWVPDDYYYDDYYYDDYYDGGYYP